MLKATFESLPIVCPGNTHSFRNSICCIYFRRSTDDVMRSTCCYLWSREHLRVVVLHLCTKFCPNIKLPRTDIRTFYITKFQMAAVRHLLFVGGNWSKSVTPCSSIVCIFTCISHKRNLGKFGGHQHS